MPVGQRCTTNRVHVVMCAQQKQPTANIRVRHVGLLVQVFRTLVMSTASLFLIDLHALAALIRCTHHRTMGSRTTVSSNTPRAMENATSPGGVSTTNPMPTTGADRHPATGSLSTRMTLARLASCCCGERGTSNEEGNRPQTIPDVYRPEVWRWWLPCTRTADLACPDSTVRSVLPPASDTSNFFFRSG